MKWLLTATEIGMLAYWVMAGSMALGVISLPPEWMYSDYQNPMVVAWNWSFFPIDVLFAVTGLAARFLPMAAGRAHGLAIVSLTLMVCAGLMAVSFWLIRGEYDVFWWSVNLWLVVLGSVGLFLRMRAAA